MRAPAVNLRPRGAKAQGEMELCNICDDYIPAEDQCTCSKCGSLGHPSCQGLDAPAGDFVCRHCAEQGKIGDINDLGIEEGKASIGPVEEDDDGTYEDTEDMAMQQSGRTLPQQRAGELLYDDFSILLGNQDLNDFASETQPDDDTRHALVLLSLPVDHTWTDDDPFDEHDLRIGLLLLFNLIQDQDQLATSRSPHIHYSHFPNRVRDKVTNRLVVTEVAQKDLTNAATAVDPKTRKLRSMSQADKMTAFPGASAISQFVVIVFMILVIDENHNRTMSFLRRPASS